MEVDSISLLSFTEDLCKEDYHIFILSEGIVIIIGVLDEVSYGYSFLVHFKVVPKLLLFKIMLCDNYEAN